MIRQTGTRYLPLPRLAYVAGAELALSLIGGGLAVMSHINTFADAFGNKSEMAMPWPMLILTVAGGLAVARWRGWRGVLGTLAVALPCLLALLSTGDDETFKPGLPTWVYVYQVAILVAAAAGLIAAGMQLRSLWRRAPEPLDAEST